MMPDPSGRWSFHRVRSWRVVEGVGVAVLLACLVGLTLASARRESLTTDEALYIGSGYHMLTTRDYSIAPNPAGLPMLLASPLLLMNVHPLRVSTPYFAFGELSLAEVWRYGMQFLWQANRAHAGAIIAAARSVSLALSVLLGLAVFVWSRRIYGAAAGVLALFLYVLSPNILAHSGLATLDIGFTAVAFAAFYAFRRLLLEPGWRRLLVAGLLLGLAEVA